MLNIKPVVLVAGLSLMCFVGIGAGVEAQAIPTGKAPAKKPAKARPDPHGKGHKTVAPAKAEAAPAPRKADAGSTEADPRVLGRKMTVETARRLRDDIRAEKEEVQKREIEFRKRIETDGDLLRKAKTMEWDKDALRWKMSPETEMYARMNLENLRHHIQTINGRMIGKENITRGILMSLLTNGNAYLYGEAGGAKSAVAKYLFSIPSLSPFGKEVRRFSPVKDLWKFQMHQMVSDAQIKGFIDPNHINEETKEKISASIRRAVLKKVAEIEKEQKSKLTPAQMEEIQINIRKEKLIEAFQGEGTLILGTRAIVDELDKGNPLALAALLDVLNERYAQHGDITIKAKTKSVVFTSNMTVHQLYSFFKDAGMESTADALLDRAQFKIYSHNQSEGPKEEEEGAGYEISALERVFEAAAESAIQSIDRSASRPSDHSPGLELEGEGEDLGYPVDFAFLRNWARVAGRRTQSLHGEDTLADYRQVQLRLWVGVRDRFNKRRETDEDELAAGTLDRPTAYHPSNILSDRSAWFSANVVNNDLLLDLLELPGDLMPQSKMMKLLNGGVPSDFLSTWRLIRFMSTIVPGKMGLKFSSEGGADRVSLELPSELETLLKSPQSRNSKFLYQDLIWELTQFKEVWESLAGRRLGEIKSRAEFQAMVKEFFSSKGEKMEFDDAGSQPSIEFIISRLAEIARLTRN